MALETLITVKRRLATLKPMVFASDSTKQLKKNSTALLSGKGLSHSLEELQIDLDLWIKRYNEFRPHSGRHCYGKTPMQTFWMQNILRKKRCDMYEI